MATPRLVAFFIKEFKEVIPPTLFFLAGFNLIVLTTQLILADYLAGYWAGLGNFLLATTAALVVGKAVLVTNHMPFLRRYDNAPLIRPVLFKTFVYWAIVFLVRFLEHLVRYLTDGGTLAGLPDYVALHFSWQRFAAIQIWIFVLFLIYTLFSELNELFGQGELYKILFTRRTSELKLSRRQRIRTLVRLNELTAAHGLAELRDPASAAHAEMVGLIQGLTTKTPGASRPAA
ncbi:MAG TPA: hypothetical protein VHA10_24300 [Hypericibacter adhaerens]|uniref:hypothetical protein n=1 Tax=Hypericibacter adhaerens TaxID=2602016 RepID=UPI002BEA5B49|nr:hypothetical protein [Hypericibacter adhaerens]HWA46362.1 hypothetical protein [Hypericibacter adhaerens]